MVAGDEILYCTVLWAHDSRKSERDYGRNGRDGCALLMEGGESVRDPTCIMSDAMQRVRMASMWGRQRLCL